MLDESQSISNALRPAVGRLSRGLLVEGIALAEVDIAQDRVTLTVDAASMFGLGEQETVVSLERFHATVFPEDREEIQSQIRKACDPNGPGWCEMEHRVILPEGRIRWVRVRTQFFSDAGADGDHQQRRSPRAVLVALDITREKSGDPNLLRSHEVIQSLLNSLPEHIVVLDERGNVIAVNEAWERFGEENGGSAYAISVGANYFEVCRRSASAGDADAERVLLGLQSLLAGECDQLVAEYPCHGPYAERWFLMHAQRLTGGSRYLVLSHVDISRRKRAERNLAFLAELSETFAPLATVDDILRIAADRLTQHFRLSRVNFSDVSPELDRITTFFSQHAADQKEDRITHRLSEYLDASLVDALKIGAIIAVNDVSLDPRTRAQEAAYRQWNIASMMLAPHLVEGGWKFLIVAHKSTPHLWEEDERQTLQEAASRIHLRIDRARAEQALRASQQTFQHLVENSPFGVYVVDADFRLVEVSVGAREVFKHLHPLLGRDFSEVMRTIWEEPFASEAIDRFRHTLSTGESYHTSTTTETRRDIGERESYDWQIERIDLPDGRPGVVCHFYDLSEIRRVESELRASEERFRQLVEQTVDGIFLSDANGRYLAVNTAGCDMLGASREEILSQSMADFIAEESDRAILAEMYATATGQSVRRELNFRRKDRTIFVGEFAGRQLQNEQLLGIVRDVTERKRNEDTLRESESRFRAMADGLPLIVWEHDCEGNLVFVNKTFCQYFGVNRDHMRDERWQWLVYPEDLSEYASEFMACVQERRAFHRSVRVRRHDGQWRWMESWANPRFGSQGVYLGHVGTSADVTERIRAEEVLREQDKRKDEFLATLAHELRNPLAPIRIGLEIMKMAKDDPVIIEETRQTMERQTQQLVTLVNDLLDVARITQGKFQLRKRRTNFAEILQSAIEASRPLINEAEQTLAVSVPGQQVYLDVDPNRMAQVLSNLLNNASKYTPPNGKISIEAECQNNELVLRISDTGIGIPPELQHRVFEMFAQINQAQDQSYVGLGIGLSLVSSLVAVHGGTISVFSEGVNRGSTFTIHLPTSPAQCNEPETPPSNPRVEPGPLGLRVLVVDDNAAAARTLSVVVRMLGNEVRTAGDGEEACKLAAEFRPDVILMDIGMPKMNGFEAAKAIRQQSWGTDICLVALTGWGQEEDRQKTQEAGFDHHLVKPAEPKALEELLNRVKTKRSSD